MQVENSSTIHNIDMLGKTRSKMEGATLKCKEINVRKVKDVAMAGTVYGSAILVIGILVIILGYIFSKGLPHINLHFLTAPFENNTTYVFVNGGEGEATVTENSLEIFGAELTFDKESRLIIKSLQSDSILESAVDGRGTTYSLKKGDVISKIGSNSVEELVGANVAESLSKVKEAFAANQEDSLRLKVVRLGGGILPMLVTTLYIIAISILAAVPIGVLAAIYINEYAKDGKILQMIRFAIINLSGIPSIIYGLFGALFFVQVCHMRYSILAGGLTVSIILLPTIISTTEEALKSIPDTYRHSSLGLGATKLQTVMKIVLPNALPGILVAVILSIGRVVGESAALLLTAGTVAQIPTALVGDKGSGATLTIKAYTLMLEEGDISTASAIGVVLIVMIVALNFLSKYITKVIGSKNQ